MTFEELRIPPGGGCGPGSSRCMGHRPGLDAASEALAYGWEHWERLSEMENPAGYLYRVGQTAARRAHRPHGFLPAPPPVELADFEPRLVPALQRLSEQQRVAVVLTCAYGCLQTNPKKWAVGGRRPDRERGSPLRSEDVNLFGTGSLRIH
jgi:hypothetical protein